MTAGNNSDLAFVNQLIADYPEFRFCFNKKRFSFRANTIFIGPPQPFFALQTLHELGHAIKGHKDYTTHVDRIKIEREAWETAKTVYQKYLDLAKTDPKIAEILPKWNDDYIEDCLDTYRDWLHTNSKCKKCGLTRYQTTDGKYHCPRCGNFS